MSNSIINLPFDQFTRQTVVKNIIDSTRRDREKFTILDVGGYKGATAQFHRNDMVTILDLYDVDEPGYIKGDGTKLAFGDNSFDYVVSFDALEHVPLKERTKFLHEMFRVSKYGVVLTFPFKSENNDAAEYNLNKLYKKLHNKDHPWLKEHIDYTLPDLGVVRKDLNSISRHTRVYFSNPTEVWFAMQSSMFLTSAILEYAGDPMRKLNASYNRAYSGDHGDGQFYRAIVVCFKNDLRHKQHLANYESPNKDQPHNPYRVLERVNEFHNEVVEKFMESIAAKQRDLNIEIKNNKKLLDDIDRIRNSRSYKVVRSIQKSRSVISNRRPKS